ncbi:hypothetical protein HWV62_29747 [Athelia sp. TMB]|nr:hypothetical protein HWV62_29747 [Athelia sp. TMB]
MRSLNLPPPISRGKNTDDAIRSTDGDASLARLSAVRKGYLQDPYVTSLVPGAHLKPSLSPQMNLGTYVRSTAIDALVDDWLRLAESTGQQCQIVSLGAGSDTRFWRLATGDLKHTLAKYIELDFKEITTAKAGLICKNQELTRIIGEMASDQENGTVLSSVYNLLPCDLRTPPSGHLAPLLASTTTAPLLSPALPTLLLFECVLVYMAPAASTSLIKWFVDYLDAPTALGAVVYEMFGLDDAFGRMMLSNLKKRNLHLPGAYPTLESLSARFTALGFTHAGAARLPDIRNSCVPRAELERIVKLEMLDELEELDLTLNHYAITWAAKAPADGSEAWGEWRLHAAGIGT